MNIKWVRFTPSCRTFGPDEIRDRHGLLRRALAHWTLGHSGGWNSA